MKKGVLFILLASLVTGCTTIGVYEKTQAFADQTWASANRLNFSFDITDTAAGYNVFVVLRHTDAYRYNNIYLNVTSINPGDSAITTRQNLTLANNSGWLGTAMDDIIEHRIAINRSALKLKKGKYQVMLQQIMRDDPLPGMLNAGIRVEKAVQ